MGSKKNKSSSATTNQMTDNRQVVDGTGNLAIGAGGRFSSWSDSSTDINVTDQSQRTDARSYSTNVSDSRSWADNSRQETNTTITGADSAQIVALTSGLQRDMAREQSDGVRAVAGFGSDAMRVMGGAATDIYRAAGQNSAEAWGHTLDASEAALDRMFSAAAGLTGAATQIAGAAIQSYQPADSRAQETGMKLGVIAAGVAAAVLLMRKQG